MPDLIAAFEFLQFDHLASPVGVMSVALFFVGGVVAAAERRVWRHRKICSDDLRTTAQSFQLLFDSNPLPMWVFDPRSLRFLAVNDTAVRSYGYSRAQFESMTLLDIRAPAFHAKLRAATSVPRDVPDGTIWSHRRADGSEFDVLVYSRMLNDSDERSVLVAAIDVSAQRSAEADLRKARAFLDTIFDHVPVSVFVKELASDQYVLVNRAAEKLLGLPRESIIGRRPADFDPGEAAKTVREQDLARLRAGETVTISEHDLRTPQGDLRRVTTKRVVVSTGEGAPEYMVAVVHDHTDLAAARDRIAYLGRHDSLTGLRNRVAFMDDFDAHLKAAATDERSVILVSVDICNFTEVNDVGGPLAGDEILKAVAMYLEEDDSLALVGRVGGDEFMFAFNHARADAASDFAHHLNDVVRRCGAAFREGITLGVSVGIAIFPSDGDDAMTLMTNAEAAQHRAKQQTCQHVCFFEAAIDQKLREQRRLHRDLDLAIRHHEFLPYYQPQARIDGTIYGFEALLRWQHPQRGMVSPLDFIPAAEDSGQIIEVGDLMLRQVCAEAASWPRELDVAVNLSPVQFEQADLPGRIAEILAETGLPAHRLELEITESVLIGDSRRALRILHELKALGLRIAMDDFGTGYSSLAYLQAFPFDRLKIDRQFISGLETSPQSAAIVKAVIGLGHGLGLPVLAEGVETPAQLETLQRLGCDEVQGFLIGRPQELAADSPLFGLPPEPRRALARVG
jgi:diguanylate cyclase (GGDEF)-like protein/PAS domain S-box-containing protein